MIPSNLVDHFLLQANEGLTRGGEKGSQLDLGRVARSGEFRLFWGARAGGFGELFECSAEVRGATGRFHKHVI